MSVFVNIKRAANHITLAAFLLFHFTAVEAASVNGQFNVTVDVKGGKPIANNSAFCKRTNDPNAFGATVTVVCATGAVVDVSPTNSGQPFSPTHGGAYRYLFQAVRGGDLIGTVDSYVGAGNVTSWRVVNLRDRDYVEMLVNW